MRILIVDDEPFSRELVACMLENEGRQIDMAGNGLEALRLLTKDRYSLVLVDYHMPVMDGCTLARMIRGNPAMINFEVPIIALTATIDSSTVADCKSAGMNDCLAKPLGQDELEEMLKRWVGVSKGSDQVLGN